MASSLKCHAVCPCIRRAVYLAVSLVEFEELSQDDGYFNLESEDN